MPTLMATGLFAVAGCGGGSLSAQPGDTVSWTNPTMRTDGTPLTNLASIKIRWGMQGGPYDAGEDTVSEPATSTFIPQPPGPRTTCYVAVAVDANGLESVDSNEACKTVAS